MGYIYGHIENSLTREQLDKLDARPVYVDPSTVRLKINATIFAYNVRQECYRERMVNYINLLPLLEKQVRLEDADYILYMHPFARVEDMWRSVEHDLNVIDEYRKPDAEIIVLGKACNIRGMLSRKIRNVTYFEDNFVKKLGRKFGIKNMHGSFYAIDDNYCKTSIWPVDGCKQKCAFCRRTYMEVPYFHSVPLKQIKSLLDGLRNTSPEWMQVISLRAENLTEYGLDLYGERRLYEVLELINEYPEIKVVEMPIGLCIGELTGRDIEAICNLKPVISVIAANVEVGTDRLLKLLNKPHTVARAREVIKRIRRAHPEMDYGSTVMVGVPTERLEDIDALADLLVELNADWVQINIIGISDRSPLANLPKLSPSLIEYHKNRLVSLLKKAGREVREGKREIERFHRESERSEGGYEMIVKYCAPRNKRKNVWRKCDKNNVAHPYDFPVYVSEKANIKMY